MANDEHKHARSPWRSFRGPPSAGCQRQAMVILKVMFAWPVQAGYLAVNPYRFSISARRAKPRTVRYQPSERWLTVKFWI